MANSVTISNPTGYLLKITIDYDTTLGVYEGLLDAGTEPTQGQTSDIVKDGNGVFTIGGATYTSASSKFKKGYNYKTISATDIAKTYVVLLIQEVGTNSYEIVDVGSINSVFGGTGFSLDTDSVDGYPKFTAELTSPEEEITYKFSRTTSSTSKTIETAGEELPDPNEYIASITESGDITDTLGCIALGEYGYFYLSMQAGDGPDIIVASCEYGPATAAIDFINETEAVQDLFVADDASSLISSQNSASAVAINTAEFDGSYPYIKVFAVASGNALSDAAVEAALNGYGNVAYAELANADISGLGNALNTIIPKLTGSIKLSFDEKPSESDGE